MTRAPLLHRSRPALVAVALLACLAVAIPVLSPHGGDGSVEAVRGFLADERPVIPALIAQAKAPMPGPALGPRAPRFVQPARLSPARPDPAPDLRITWLSVTAGYPPVDLPAIIAASGNDWTVTPRRKPSRPARMPVIDIVSRVPPAVPAPPPEVDPVATALPEIAALPGHVIVIPPTDAPRIALVVTAAGLHEATTRRAIETLPGGITLAFAPVGARSGALARAAIADGHTVLVEIPMEPLNPRLDPGEALTLRIAHADATNIAKLDEALSRVPGAAGISSYLGAKFTTSDRAATPVIDHVAARGLFLFENQPNARSRLGALARSRDVPYATAAIALDTERGETAMLERLVVLESQARREGVAIGVATAYRESISALERWVAGARQRGIVFVPVTRLQDAG